MARKLTAYQSYMRRALKGKMKGKTKAQRKAIFKAAAKGWKGKSKPKRRSNPVRRRSKPRSSSNKSPKRGGRMAKGFLNTQTIMSLVRKGSLVLPAAYRLMENRPLGGPGGKLAYIIADYTGFSVGDGSFDWSRLVRGWGPYVFSSLITTGIQKLTSMIRRLF